MDLFRSEYGLEGAVVFITAEQAADDNMAHSHCMLDT
jgi:hypothetical protein